MAAAWRVYYYNLPGPVYFFWHTKRTRGGCPQHAPTLIFAETGVCPSYVLFLQWQGAWLFECAYVPPFFFFLLKKSLRSPVLKIPGADPPGTAACHCQLLLIRVQKRWRHKTLFLDFSVLDTMYRWSMMKNIHSPNWVGIGSWGPEIWPHVYLISPIEISVNWPGSKQLWTRPIYTDFNGAN